MYLQLVFVGVFTQYSKIHSGVIESRLELVGKTKQTYTLQQTPNPKVLTTPSPTLQLHLLQEELGTNAVYVLHCKLVNT